VVPSLAGPSRPQQRVPLDGAKSGFRSALHAALSGDAPPATDTVSSWADEASEESFPASDAPAIDSETAAGPEWRSPSSTARRSPRRRSR
jgi:aconitate hydratase